MRKSILIAMTAILLLALATVAMAAGDPFVGTWKLNVAKSKVNPPPLPKSITMKFEPKGDGFRWASDFVPTDEGALHMECSGKYDGKDYPVTGDPNTDTTSFRKINAYTHETLDKKAGKEVGKWQLVVSKGGKTLTQTGKFKDAKGQEFTVTAVFDKQ